MSVPTSGEGNHMVTSVDLQYPFAGRWLTRNSPADRLPSHGTTLFGTTYAIDFVPVDGVGRTAALSLRSLVSPEPAARFPGLGRPLLAPAEGIVVAAHDSEPDHDAYRGLPSLGYALMQRRRAGAGWLALAGNHVLLEPDVPGGVVIALCHLQRGSVRVRSGHRVRVGDVLGRCGNSGNSTEPHVHVQALDGPAVERRCRSVELQRNGAAQRGDRRAVNERFVRRISPDVVVVSARRHRGSSR